MSQEQREIKVTKCGKHEGCEYNDRVSIEFSPVELTSLIHIFTDRAEIEKNYDRQDYEHKRCELFTEARRIWRTARKEAEQK